MVCSYATAYCVQSGWDVLCMLCAARQGTQPAARSLQPPAPRARAKLRRHTSARQSCRAAGVDPSFHFASFADRLKADSHLEDRLTLHLDHIISTAAVCSLPHVLLDTFETLGRVSTNICQQDKLSRAPPSSPSLHPTVSRRSPNAPWPSTRLSHQPIT